MIHVNDGASLIPIFSNVKRWGNGNISRGTKPLHVAIAGAPVLQLSKFLDVVQNKGITMAMEIAATPLGLCVAAVLVILCWVFAAYWEAIQDWAATSLGRRQIWRPQ